MNLKNFIPLHQLSEHYNLDVSFFVNLKEYGLIEIMTYEENTYISLNSIGEIERIIRIHYELRINMEGIDVVLNLLKKIDTLQAELDAVKSKLEIYENL